MDIFNIDWMELLDVFFSSIVSLVTLFFVTKLLGKKQVSQLSLFDYVIGISIGNFAAEMTINTDSPYLNGTVAVIFFGVIAYFISRITMKSIKLRRFFTGVPTVIIEKGEIIEDNLRRVNFDLNDLSTATDCSSYVSILVKEGNPNFNSGSTGTFLADKDNITTVDINNILPGDILTSYGHARYVLYVDKDNDFVITTENLNSGIGSAVRKYSISDLINTGYFTYHVNYDE